MSEIHSPKRILGEVAHLFFSEPQPRPAWHDDSVHLPAQGRIPAPDLASPCNQGRDLLSSLFFSGDLQSPSAVSQEGLILLDQEKVVAFINRSAQDLLGLTDKKYLGQLFDYFITLAEPLQVSIFRKDRTMGVGEMIMTEHPEPEPGSGAYTVTVRDITDRLAHGRPARCRQ